MRIASLDGSTGWVAGIVGVHPWEMAMADAQVQEEIWGQDNDTWIASPYAPMGILRPVDGGYVFNGRWQFSSGTDHCDWIFLGAFIGDAEGKPDHAAAELPRRSCRARTTRSSRTPGTSSACAAPARRTSSSRTPSSPRTV